jgi:Cys-tRNA(Pro)/Cys-tRNA(Cys) deacylase
MTFYEELVQRLAASGVDYRIHEHAPSVTVVHAETYLDFPVEQLLKTIAFRIKQGDWVLAALCGHSQVDYKKLAAVCGVSRDKLMRLNPEAVEQELGFEIGGVSPLARQPNLRVIIDSGALQYEQLFCGTGRKDRTLEIGPGDLVKLAGATVAALVKG